MNAQVIPPPAVKELMRIRDQGGGALPLLYQVTKAAFIYSMKLTQPLLPGPCTYLSPKATGLLNSLRTNCGWSYGFPAAYADALVIKAKMESNCMSADLRIRPAIIDTKRT
jgi:hypothetical protein